MENRIYALFEASNMPEWDTLQNSIDALGFDLKLHPNHTLFNCESGDVLYVLNGEKNPCNVLFYQEGEISEWIEYEKELESLTDGHEYFLIMDLDDELEEEAACIMIICCALAKDFNAIISKDGEPMESFESMLAETREIVRKIQEKNVRPRHCKHKTELTIKELIDEALKNDSVEIEMALSRTFYDWDYDENELTGEEALDYDTYYKEAVLELNKHLGIPVFEGYWQSPDFKQWKKAVCPTANVHMLSVWENGSKRLYLRHSQPEKEFEILVAFGVEGCHCKTHVGYDDE